MKSAAQARKFFYDWLDKTRPWAKPNVNCYQMMEEIVQYATMCFTDERVPTLKEIERLEKSLLNVTTQLDDHPKGHKDICNCWECRTAG